MPCASGFLFSAPCGGYTKLRFIVRYGKKVSATITKQFVVENIGFFKDGVVITRTSPRDVLLTADLVVMKISNKKMGGWDRPSPNIRQGQQHVRYPRWHT